MSSVRTLALHGRRAVSGPLGRNLIAGLALLGIACPLVSVFSPWQLGRDVAAAAGPAALVALVVFTWIRSGQSLGVLRDDAFLHRDDLLLQVQSLFYIHSQIRCRQLLPAMGGWAISPDFAALLVSLVNERKPKLVVEASSGVSTLLIAYCLQQQGRGGKVIALEHDPAYAAQSSAEVVRHGLEGVAEVVHAPLREYSLNGGKDLWYDDKALRDLADDIDMLVIDGPPAELRPLCRYPAVPLLYSHLSGCAAVLLDDANRDDEKETVRRWCLEYPELMSRHFMHSKGTELLVRGHVSSRTAQRPLS